VSDRLACDGLMLMQTGGAVATGKHSGSVEETNEGRGADEFLLPPALWTSAWRMCGGVLSEMDDQNTRRLMMP
jgi:hypothetical protein